MIRTRGKTSPVLTRASKRAGTLIEAMLREMQHGLKQPAKLGSKEWICLFGDKQSMVLNLQKLVQSLASLSESRTNPSNGLNHPEEDMMNLQDIQILSAWAEEEERAAPEA